MQTTQQFHNELVIYRQRMKFTQQFVAELLGHPNTGILSRYEHGRLLPTLQTALCLEIIYRVPVAFLFPALYAQLRNDIRAKEAAKAGSGSGQQRLL